MKRILKFIAALVVAVVLIGGWVVHYHSALVAPLFSHAAWTQKVFNFVAAAPAADAGAGDDSDAVAADVPVQVTQISRFTFHRYIEGYGTVAPRPPQNGRQAGSAAIAAPVAGIVAQVLCQGGQVVHRGQALIQLDDRLAKAQEDQAAASLAEAQASLANLKATPRPQELAIATLAVQKSRDGITYTQKEYDRQKRLAAEQGTSAKALEQAAMALATAQNDLAVNQNQLSLLEHTPTPQELAGGQAKVAQAKATLAAAQTQVQLMRIVAPIDGTITQINVTPGQSVDPTQTLGQLVDLDHLVVDVNVPAAQLPLLSTGLTAQVIADQTNGSCQGTIYFISPQIDSVNGTVQVGLDLPPKSALRPGQTVHVRIIAQVHKNRLAVPQESVVTDEQGHSVIDRVDNGVAKQVAVQVGFKEDNWVEISAAGVKAGQTVVTAGAYGLPDGTQVTITP
jgi:multidrug efflux pump subunit AcrA (membrane-fusion protein)